MKIKAPDLDLKSVLCLLELDPDLDSDPILPPQSLSLAL